MFDLMITLSVPLAFGVMWAVESRFPARDYPRVSRWPWLGVAFFVLTAGVGSVIPHLWHSLGVPIGVWGSAAPWLGVPAAILLTTGLTYGWHRSVHTVNALWLATHQLHHAPARVDIPGAFFSHPFEVAVKSSVGALVATALLGLDPTSASGVASIIGLLSLFQHWNVHTPRWLGWWVPRPEMHALHHVEGGRVVNFGDLPVWDWVFGTFVNPASFEGTVGFAGANTPKVGAMLLMRDVQD
ncbi:MAG: sterol desaturase family protein [Myxococcota bacterium]